MKPSGDRSRTGAGRRDDKLRGARAARSGSPSIEGAQVLLTVVLWGVIQHRWLKARHGGTEDTELKAAFGPELTRSIDGETMEKRGNDARRNAVLEKQRSILRASVSQW